MAEHPCIKVAAAQYPLDEVASLEAWQAKLSQWVSSGVETGADLLVFPEYAALEQAAPFGREVANDLKLSLAKVAELAGNRIETYVALARQFNVHILAGSGPVRTNDGAYVNAAQLVTPTGLVGEQEKLMMTPFERDWGISAGRTVRVFQTDLATLGVAICYDIEFPLIARAMATAGADLILVPSCTERVSGYHRVRTAARARALENTLATVQSPTVGDALWSPAIDVNCGAAGIYVPAELGISDTGVVADGTLNAPQWVTGSIDLIKLKALRTGGEMHNFDDWTRQPGANAAPANVEVIDLRSK